MLVCLQVLDSYIGRRAAGEWALQAARCVRQPPAGISLLDVRELSGMDSQQRAAHAEMRNVLHVQQHVLSNNSQPGNKAA